MNALKVMDGYRKEVIQVSTRKLDINVQYLYDNCMSTLYLVLNKLLIPEPCYSFITIKHLHDALHFHRKMNIFTIDGWVEGWAASIYLLIPCTCGRIGFGIGVTGWLGPAWFGLCMWCCMWMWVFPVLGVFGAWTGFVVVVWLGVTRSIRKCH